MNQREMEQARFNMVEQQIRTWSVLDMKVLDLMQEIPREDFVPAEYRNLAYSDIAIPLANGQEMMHPKLEAHMIQALNLEESDRVLQVGAATGYSAAIMSRLANTVYAVELDAQLMKNAGANLRQQGIDNVVIEEGDASNGWEAHAPYNAIAVTGSVAQVSEGLKHNLAIGGRLFIVVGERPAMEAVLITRTSENNWATKSLFETDLPALENAAPVQEFVF